MAKNQMLLYGKNSVYERLKIRPESIKKIFLEETFKAPHIEKLIRKRNIPVERLTMRKIENMKRAKNVQGIIACVDVFSYALYETLLQPLVQSQNTVIFLDRINDPQNLGVIIRTLACFGGFDAVIPEKAACRVTEAVLHVASGGENYVRLAMVSDILQAVKTAKARGYRLMGGIADADGAQDINKLRISFPCALVLGAETTGISAEIRELLDAKVYIPMPGAHLSLNVSMAATIFSYEITRQRKEFL
ncbi:MAG: RNA methyltransferase [Candidatus Omnitrophica bacterium]|nr:RNA methyltransferase [Candidatus Omnitrophota bacterium]MBU4478693.1 RNA methyltransferase [Candidatus Omnitrophota bacterium]